MDELHPIVELYEAFEAVPAPKYIPHHREGCCGSDEDYERLLRKPRQALDARDFSMYLPHVLLTAGTTEDFTYFLPRLLELWIACQPEGSCMDDWLFTALLSRGFFHQQLAPELRVACLRFIDRTLLGLLDDLQPLDAVVRVAVRQRMEYVWPALWYTRGQLGPLRPLWDEWWRLRTMGRARAAVEFVSCLAFLDEGNPIFGPWTPDGGGGPPSLEEDLSIGSSPGWLPEHVEEFDRRMTVESLAELVRRSALMLPFPGEQTLVRMTADCLAATPEIAQLRLRELRDSVTSPIMWMEPLAQPARSSVTPAA